jgi:hypothetical protein
LPRRLRFFNNSPRVPVGQFRIETESKLRELDRDVGANTLFVDLREYVQILFNFRSASAALPTDSFK